MVMRAFVTLVAALVCCGIADHSVADDSPDATLVKRAVVYLREAGEQWISDRGCVSCHQIPPMLWAHHAAASTGTELDQDQLSKWFAWSTDVVNFVKPHQKQGVDEQATMSGNIDTMAQLLLAGKDDFGSDWRKKFTRKLVSEQAKDGSWKACGQLPLQRRPKLETTAVTTLWVTLALLRENVSFDRTAAITFADQVKDAESIEWWATRLLVADQLGEDVRASLQSELENRQNKDGGWGWKRGQASDALGTGYALYALAYTGGDSEIIQRAREYLAKTQGGDGQWEVPGTKQAAKGESTETATDWGTAWAVIGLAASSVE
jgi:squalene-hopene/tetraprenyl-beta-curcumene cyclase